jgi:hypothetical protein
MEGLPQGVVLLVKGPAKDGCPSREMIAEGTFGFVI